MGDSLHPNPSLPLLRHAAEKEAAAFELPPDWRNGRQLREGYIIDGSSSSAISVTDENDGLTAHLSVIDVGSFSRQLPAVTALAQRILLPYYSKRVSFPLVPPQLSEGKLRIEHLREQPVVTVSAPIDNTGDMGEATIAREIIRPINFAELGPEQTIVPDKLELLKKLGHVARSVYHAYGGPHVILQDIVEDNRAQRDRISLEFRKMANLAMSRFFFSHSLPGLYQRLNQAGGGEYQIRPSQLRPDLVIRFSAPWLRFADFANHAILAAHLDGAPPPFSENQLTLICSRYALPKVQREIRAPGIRERITCEEAYAKLESDISENDFTKIFFGEITDVSDEEVIKLRRKAFELLFDVEERGGVAYAAVRCAQQKRLLIPEKADDQKWLVDNEGNWHLFDIHESGSRWELVIKSLYLLGQHAELDLSMGDIAEHVRKAVILREGWTFLRELSELMDVPLSKVIDRHPDGTYTFTVQMPLPGERYAPTASATAKENRVARRLALKEFILKNDLLDNPPEPV